MSSGHLLVVDDNEINRDMLRMRLELRGYHVVLATGGADALELLGNRPAEAGFDLVLLDVMMPEVSGIDVLKAIRRSATLADLPVIMVTARDESDGVVEALTMGANDYLTKPIDFPVLFARLETHLRLRKLTVQKDEFMAIASHDLKNPLALVKGYVTMVREYLEPGQPVDAATLDMLGRVLKQTDTMQRIVSDYLDFHAIEEGHMVLARAPRDLRQVVSSTCDNYAAYAASKGITLRCNLSPEPVVAAIDKTRIIQILNNLVSNALKFSPGGTTSEVLVESRDGWAIIDVSDQGPGIPPEERSRLFQKFARLSNRPTGGEKSSGLGLTISRQLAVLHGGDIEALSPATGNGSIFRLKLPQK